ncbi:predicted protein [Plenodomus lingam JN3]|uniref:Predicted protein n=1 Tax=Leptosphaeria maculans (strain JN3 / isolate v23.1.3 / race Av1-4-5-6-7-8) TaxID=985895 RepID=E4ZZ10_LEPMJ|nr:predicted protein [Plenodomus lingam JN3]CBX96445.1 predicted protein [Plenodomus lingam JN3]
MHPHAILHRPTARINLPTPSPTHQLLRPSSIIANHPTNDQIFPFALSCKLRKEKQCGIGNDGRADVKVQRWKMVS